MPITTLSQASAYNPGHDLWVMSAPPASRWPHKMDWYLNFQFSRSIHHQSQTLPEQIKYVLHETELDQTLESTKVDFKKIASNGLLIRTDHLLPNRWVLILDDTSDRDSDKMGAAHHWIEKVHTHWEKMNRPSLRVFLPSTLTPGDFAKEWAKKDSFEEFTVVNDYT